MTFHNCGILRSDAFPMTHFLASRTTQAAIVDGGTAESNHSRFIMICRSSGVKSLVYTMRTGEKASGRENDRKMERHDDGRW